MGIQYSTYLSLAKKLLGITPSEVHFKAMTRAEAQKFIEYYWNIATNNNTINDQSAANLMFQAFWGSGNAGIKDMQRALNIAYNSNLNIDGDVGTLTVAAINRNKNAAQVLYAALETRYKLLAQKSEYSRYLNGWLNRLRTLKPTAVIGGTAILLILGTFLFLNR
jgi:lysozyme family protein